MKEIKKFFTNNRLNKGYNKTLNNPRQSDSHMIRQKSQHILPPIDIISEYENISPGTLESLMNLAKKEQEHRHNMEVLQLAKKTSLQKIAQISAIFVMITLCLTSILLFILSGIISATIFVACAFAFLAAINLKTHTRTGSYNQYRSGKKPPYRNNK